ncbi:flavin reductase family protein [Marinobacter confluentis]|uniref:Flavin reductase family protein n=1 Tax=Marinobacter confluentis TaxID=1697557 RepID=A0A4Z1BRH0_9GAMM|nr:flavin reductase family protein [Marinobacter confluentis]TGN40215.1 flavin reductase family protein [Marinobacter confluentis]
MLIDLSTIDASHIHPILTQAIIPRPVAWVLSRNPGDDFNLAPYSFFTVVTSKPPILMVSVGKKPADGVFKDTRVNIETRKQFVVHIGDQSHARAMTLSSRHLDHGQSELDELDLKLVQDEGWPMPRVEGCPVALYCELREVIEMGDTPQSLVFGDIKQVFVDDRVATINERGRFVFDAKGIDPIARLGGSEYGTLGEILNVPRPD